MDQRINDTIRCTSRHPPYCRHTHHVYLSAKHSSNPPPTTAYYIAYGAHGPRAPIVPPNTNGKVFMGVTACIVAAFSVFALVRANCACCRVLLTWFARLCDPAWQAGRRNCTRHPPIVFIRQSAGMGGWPVALGSLGCHAMPVEQRFWLALVFFSNRKLVCKAQPH